MDAHHRRRGGDGVATTPRAGPCCCQQVHHAQWRSYVQTYAPDLWARHHADLQAEEPLLSAPAATDYAHPAPATATNQFRTFGVPTTHAGTRASAPPALSDLPAVTQWLSVRESLLTAEPNSISADDIELAIDAFHALDALSQQIAQADNVANARDDLTDIQQQKNTLQQDVQALLQQHPAIGLPLQMRMVLSMANQLLQQRRFAECIDLLQPAVEHLIDNEQAAALVAAELQGALRWTLANALAQTPLGSRRDNLEQAIEHYQHALEIFTQTAYPANWAMTQNNLAAAYSDRIAGARRDNIEQAIEHYQHALEIFTQTATPEQWAQTQNNLAAAYSHRIAGTRRENLEQAIEYSQHALEIYTKTAYPEQWATTQNNLATAYCERITGTRRDNLEQAIEHYQYALEIYSKTAYPADWAMTQNNLANAYSDRIAGARRDNIERAIEHYQHALEIRTKTATPEKWAQTQNNLAIAYSDRIAGTRRDNLEQAIQHYQHASEIYTKTAYPEQWAQTQNNFGSRV